MNYCCLTIFLLLSFIADLSAQISRKKLFSVSGSVTHTSDYCGGVPPSEGLLELMHKPKPLAEAKVFFRSGKTNNEKQRIAAAVTCDEQGRFSVQLPKGSYCVVLEEKAVPFRAPTKSDHMQCDENCLRENYAACEAVITVGKKANTTIAVNYHRYCAHQMPCCKFLGELPR